MPGSDKHTLFRHEFLETEGPVILARKHPQLARTLRRWAESGHLVQVAPGTYLTPTSSEDPLARMMAACVWLPGAIVQGEAAAFVHALHARTVTTIALAHSAKVQPPRGFTVTRRHIPPEFRVFAGEVCLTSPALTAVDLADSDGGSAIYTALRTGRATVDEIQAALRAFPSRRGNAARRVCVGYAERNPWSNAERELHTILDNEGLTGWVANYPVQTGGNSYLLDAAFVLAKVAIEVDGWEFHSSRSAFEADRLRQNDLVAAGWTVLRFTPAMLDDPEYVVRCVRAALTCPK